MVVASLVILILHILTIVRHRQGRQELYIRLPLLTHQLLMDILYACSMKGPPQLKETTACQLRTVLHLIQVLSLSTIRLPSTNSSTTTIIISFLLAQENTIILVVPGSIIILRRQVQ